MARRPTAPIGVEGSALCGWAAGGGAGGRRHHLPGADGPRCQLESGAGGAHRRRDRPRGPQLRCQLAGGGVHQPAAPPRLGPGPGDLRRRPGARGRPGGGLQPRHRAPRHRLREALRPQLDRQLPLPGGCAGQPAGAARALPAPLPRLRGGRRRLGDERLQPGERDLVRRTPRAAHHHPQAALGLWRLCGDRLHLRPARWRCRPAGGPGPGNAVPDDLPGLPGGGPGGGPAGPGAHRRRGAAAAAGPAGATGGLTGRCLSRGPAPLPGAPGPGPRGGAPGDRAAAQPAPAIGPAGAAPGGAELPRRDRCAGGDGQPGRSRLLRHPPAGGGGGTPPGGAAGSPARAGDRPRRWPRHPGGGGPGGRQRGRGAGGGARLAPGGGAHPPRRHRADPGPDPPARLAAGLAPLAQAAAAMAALHRPDRRDHPLRLGAAGGRLRRRRSHRAAPAAPAGGADPGRGRRQPPHRGGADGWRRHPHGRMGPTGAWSAAALVSGGAGRPCPGRGAAGGGVALGPAALCHSRRGGPAPTL